jgi:hypothetical protein
MFCSLIAGFTFSVLGGPANASPYAFSLDRVAVTGQLSGADDFDGPSLGPAWLIGEPTVVVAGGLVTLSSPGTVEVMTVNGVPLVDEGTYFGSTFMMMNGAGNFTGTATWASGIPGPSEYFGVSLEKETADQSQVEDIFMAVSNFTPDVASVLGVPAGPAVWFGKTSGVEGGGNFTDLTGVPIDDPLNVTGPILSRRSRNQTG